MGAYFGVLDGGVGLAAAFAVGHGVYLLYLQLGALAQLGLGRRPLPAVNEVAGDYAGNLSNLEGHTAYGGEGVFLPHLLDCLDDTENYA